MRHFRRAWRCRVCGYIYLSRADCRAHWTREERVGGLHWVEAKRP
jgi:rubredoxin